MWWQRRSFAAKDAAGRARLSQWVGMAAGLAFVAAAHPMTAVAAGTRVLLLDPQPADKTTKLWPELRALVTKTMADYVGRSGEYSLVRLQPGTAVGCEAIDFACFARGATAKSEFVLGAKVQVNADNTIYLTLTLLDTQNPERVESQYVPFGSPLRKRELSPDEADQLATKLEGTIGTLFRALSQSAAPPPADAAQPVSTPAVGASLTVLVDGKGSVQSDQPGFSCERAACTFSGTPPSTLTLIARPGWGRTAGWSGASCLNSVLADPFRCEVAPGQATRITVRFERTLGVKVGAGILLGLSVASLVSGAAFLGLQGQPMADGAQVYNTGKLGALSLSLGVLFGGTSGLLYFL
jgi:hypothetical protein